MTPVQKQLDLSVVATYRRRRKRLIHDRSMRIAIMLVVSQPTDLEVIPQDDFRDVAQTAITHMPDEAIQSGTIAASNT